jgi:hypothetical protein
MTPPEVASADHHAHSDVVVKLLPAKANLP